MSTTNSIKVTAAVLALIATLTLSGCSSDAPATPTPVTSSTTDTTPAPTDTETTPVVETPAAPAVDPRLEVTVAGVTYTGTDKAPLKIGTDTPGAAPAAEATFPANGSFDDIKAAATVLDTAKYTVLVTKDYAADDVAAQGASIGYQWQTFRVNEYGTWKAGETSGTLPSLQAAIDAPHTLDGRVLDRSEFVIAVATH